MFKGIVAERGRCDHCREQHLLAHIPPTTHDDPYKVAVSGSVLKLCSRCIYALTRLAALLAMFDRPSTSPKAKKAPKKARKSRRIEPDAIPGHPDAASTDSLLPYTTVEDSIHHRGGSGRGDPVALGFRRVLWDPITPRAAVRRGVFTYPHPYVEK